MPRLPAKAGKSGSPSKGEPEYLAIGLLRRPHGVHGDILMDVYTDFPELLKDSDTVFLGGNHKPASIRQIRHHNNGLILGFDGIDTPEAAGLMRNQLVYVRTSDRPELPEGQYYHHQMIGLTVVDDSAVELGSLTEIIETGANDVYVVTSNDGHEILLPAINDVVLDVDVKKKRLTVHLIPGLLDQDD